MRLFSYFERVGMILLVSGEFGNFIAYGFAPATIVAPLGATTIVG